MCVGVPCATGPICSADGEGGGEGGKLAESSTAKGEREIDRERERERERERQTNTGKTRRGWEEGNEKRSDSADLVSAGGLALRSTLCFVMSGGGYLVA